MKVLHRVPALLAGGVDHVDQKPGPLDVPEKVVPQARPLGGALDEARDLRRPVYKKVWVLFGYSYYLSYFCAEF